MFDTIPYYLVLLIAAIPALAEHNKKPSAGWLIYSFVLLIFIGLRYEVGADWDGYNSILESLSTQNLGEVMEHGELAFNSIMWLSAYLGLEIYGANIFTTGVFLYGLFKYCKTQLYPWLALFSAMPFLVIVVAMSANRQAAAIGLTLLVLALWNKISELKKLLLILLAASFHTSALIFGVFVTLSSNIPIWRKAILSGGILGVAISVLGSSEATDRYTSSYIQDTDVNVAGGAIQQVLLVVIPAVVMLAMSAKSMNFRMKLPNWGILFIMSLLSLALIPMALTYSVAASRVSFYMFPISISVLATLPEILPSKSTVMLVVIYGFLTLGLWLSFANTSFRWLPYNNLLFLGFQ